MFHLRWPHEDIKEWSVSKCVNTDTWLSEIKLRFEQGSRETFLFEDFSETIGLSLWEQDGKMEQAVGTCQISNVYLTLEWSYGRKRCAILKSKGNNHSIIRISMVFIITMANVWKAVCDQDYFARFCPEQTPIISRVCSTHGCSIVHTL